MFSFVRHLFGNEERDLERKLELLELENNYLDYEVVEEEIERNNIGTVSCMENIITNPTVQPQSSSVAGHGVNEVSGASCTARQGVITSLTLENGTIDNYIYFDRQAAASLEEDLQVGAKIEYLTYQKETDESMKVVKIIKILEMSWDEMPDRKVEEAVESLKRSQATYFNVQVRNVLGLIIERLQSSIQVDTDYGQLTVDMDNVELSFIPKTGDRICLACNVQLDDNYVDKQGEILQVLKVFPTRIESGEKCLVRRVFNDHIAVGEDAFVLREDVSNGIELHLDDVIKADLIECDFANYKRRVIKMTAMEMNFGLIKTNDMGHFSNVTGNQAITITGDLRVIFTELWAKREITLRLQNNLNRVVQLRRIEVRSANDGQISVVSPLEAVEFAGGAHTSVVLDAVAKFVGEFTETLVFHFDKFRAKRALALIVCESEEAAKEAERRLIASATLHTGGRTAAQRSRFYANQVWSNKMEVVPGECIATKRRFVAVRLGYYEVPEKLRKLYLTMERRDEALEAIDSAYPCLKEELSMTNYVQRFGLFLHLEEIDYFISFRNYDRERAHFLRNGEYLVLLIENLAERRPSLVVGDVVRAINPWAEPNSKENKKYEGIVHKVMLDRIFLKFNPSFQDKYNGEDYRLEFYFSRFGFRKQHFAISRIVTLLGDQFLFPSKIQKRAHPQLDVRYEDDEIYMYDSKLPWYNNSLNSIQKRAVYNILLGSAENVPYVIFGPPGTGKTVTLVEAILQLVRNLPSSRLLVGTPSNSSADLITKRIIDSNALQQGDFIRLVSQNQIEKDLIPAELMSYCATVDIGSVGTCQDSMVVTETGLKLRCQMKFLGRHRVTISTCTTLGNFLQMGFPSGHFTHVLIDEAGQCTEPETIIPVVMLARQRSQVVLAGDPNQLQAIVINRFAGDRGLQLSFLERLLNRLPYAKDLQRYPQSSGYNPMVLTKLLYNYRALPSIMSIYSKLFYDNELISMVSPVDSREAHMLFEAQRIFKEHFDRVPRTQGTFFNGIVGENMQESDSPSWYNQKEAREVFLATISLYRENVSADQIGILTPYVKQVKTLRNMFQASDVVMPKIGSVEEFQGQERDIMLISTVRSSVTVLPSDSRLCLGFVRCPKRMNVAISRARFLMVIFGNPHLLSVDESWRQLILFCANNNAYYGCEMPDIILSMKNCKDDDDLQDTSDYVP